MSSCADQDYLPCSPYVSTENLLCECSGVDFSDPANVELFDQFALAESRNLFASTAYKYTGCCEITFAPCKTTCSDDGPAPIDSEIWDFPAFPYLKRIENGLPVLGNCWQCSCGCEECTCWGGDTLDVPWTPIRDVVEIRIDGIVLDPSSYQVVESSKIVRTDGGHWPMLCENGTDGFTVTYNYGIDLPTGGKLVFAQYICEKVKECLGIECSISKIHRYQTKSEVKNSFVFTPSAEFLYNNMLTGFAPLDSWIMTDLGGKTRHAPAAWPRKPAGRIIS